MLLIFQTLVNLHLKVAFSVLRVCLKKCLNYHKMPTSSCLDRQRLKGKVFQFSEKNFRIPETFFIIIILTHSVLHIQINKLMQPKKYKSYRTHFLLKLSACSLMSSSHFSLLRNQNNVKFYTFNDIILRKNWLLLELSESHWILSSQIISLMCLFWVWLKISWVSEKVSSLKVHDYNFYFCI